MKDIKIELFEFLEKRTEGALVDYILEFCEEYDYDVTAVGEAIKKDKTFRTMLEADCKQHKILKSDRDEDW